MASMKALVRTLLARPVIRAALRPLGAAAPRLRSVPVVGEVSIPLGHGQSLCFVTDGADGIVNALYWSGLGAYEPEVVRVFRELAARSTGAILDIGAHTGLYALLAAAANPAAAVHAFEPVPDIFRRLEQNVRVNPRLRVNLHRAAVCDCSGEISLFIPRYVLTSEASTLPGFRADCTEVTVPAVTLDSLDLRVGLLKVDTEATEPAVLRGAAATLARDRPPILCEVLPGRTERELESILAPLGYGYFRIQPDGLTKLDRIEADYRFLNFLFAVG